MSIVLSRPSIRRIVVALFLASMVAAVLLLPARAATVAGAVQAHGDQPISQAITPGPPNPGTPVPPNPDLEFPTAPDPEGSAVTSSGAGDGTETPAPPTTVQQIYQTIKNIVTLSHASLVDAYEGLLEHAVTHRLSPFIRQLDEGLSTSFELMEDYSVEGMDGVVGGRLVQPIETLWWTLLSVSMAFASLIIVLNIVAIVSPSDSPQPMSLSLLSGLAQELPWFILAGASLWFTQLLIRVFWGTAGLIGEIAIGGVLSVSAALSAKFSLLLFAIFVPGLNIIVFYVLVGMFFLTLTLVAAMVLGHLALITLAVVWVATAPLVIVLGRIRPFRWVYGMWLRLGGGVLILPVANAILYKAVFLLLDSIDGYGPLVSAAIALGLLGLLISINFTIGKLVFGPLLQVGTMTHNAIKTVAEKGLQVLGVGISMGGSGLATAGLAAGGGPGPAGLGGGGGLAPGIKLPGGGTGAVADTVGTGSPGVTAVTPRQLRSARQHARSAHRVGAALASRDPLMRAAVDMTAAATERRLDQIEAGVSERHSAAPYGTQQQAIDTGHAQTAFDQQRALRISLGSAQPIEHPRTLMAAERVAFAGQMMNEHGHLGAIVGAGIDPDEYIGGFVAMSMSPNSRRELNTAGAQLPEHGAAYAAFRQLGAGLTGPAQAAHNTLANSLHAYIDEGYDLTVNALDGWLSAGANE